MTSNDTHAQAYIVSAVPADGSAFPYSRAVTAPGPRSAIRYAAAGMGHDAEKLAARNTARVRHHPAELPGFTPGEREFEGITEPCAVVIRPDGSVDVYGYIGVVDQRPDVAADAPGWRCYKCGAGPYGADLDECGNCGTWRKSCSCGEAWADEPGHDSGPELAKEQQ